MIISKTYEGNKLLVGNNLFIQDIAIESSLSWFYPTQSNVKTLSFSKINLVILFNYNLVMLAIEPANIAAFGIIIDFI